MSRTRLKAPNAQARTQLDDAPPLRARAHIWRTPPRRQLTLALALALTLALALALIPTLLPALTLALVLILALTLTLTLPLP